MAKLSLLGGLGGAADQVLQGMNVDRDLESKEHLMRLSSELETEKARTLAIFAEAQKAAPLNRLQSRAQALAGQGVQKEAAPVTELSGTYASDAGPSQGGFTGSPGIIQKAIGQLPAGSDRDAAMAQFQQQMSQAGAKNAAEVRGQTRPRTSEEAFDAALSEAKSTDLQAYAAGRGLATEKTVKVGEGETVIDPKTGKVIYSSGDTKSEREREREDRRDARAAASEDARDARQEKALAARERLAEIRESNKRGDDSKITKEERLRYTSLFSDAGRQMRSVQETISRLRRDPLYSMAKPGSPQREELDELRRSLAEHEKDRRTYGSLLANGAILPAQDDSAGTTTSTSPAPSSAPATRPPLSSFKR